MSKKNIKAPVPDALTHGGAAGVAPSTHAEDLRRAVMGCLLWEDQFYVDGTAIAERIRALVPLVRGADVAAMAVEAREKMKLRHVPLLLVREMCRPAAPASHRALVAETLARVVQRADELTEFLALYWEGSLGAGQQRKKEPLSAQVKRGLAAAFNKFDEYQLAKYNRARSEAAVTLRDAMFLVRPKPRDFEQAELWKRLAAGELRAPDTWEVALSGGAGKKDTFERLIREGKLGYTALLRNLRGMEAAGVDRDVVKGAILARKGAHRVLPFRFISAANAAPAFEQELDAAMVASLSERPKLAGKTIVVVDVSGSMGAPMSGKSKMDRLDAACALAAITREMCEEVAVYATAGRDADRVHKTKLVPARHGMALVAAIKSDTLGGGGVFIAQVMDFLKGAEKSADRVIVFTDEQDCDHGSRSPYHADCFGKRNYIANVASYQNGIAVKGKWLRVDGFSESVVSWIAASEGVERTDEDTDAD